MATNRPIRLSTLLSGVTCECSDPSCRTHRGQSHCTYHSENLLYRIDMRDESGTAMCDGCADDAFTSGLFTTRDDGTHIIDDDSDDDGMVRGIARHNSHDRTTQSTD